ncbi:Uncharacterised protein [Enterobacter cloacae]|uniref:Uncharacterized protein n=1 Tax=Enterobacter cloacae TaxID=550 RepID=A0A377M934_ENTCL|nr:Uncharacterised protein [Enterobacter cloacae]
MATNITFRRVLRLVGENKNMIFVNAVFEFLPKLRGFFREKAISIQEVSKGMV